MIPMTTRARLDCEVGDVPDGVVPDGVVREVVATATDSEFADGTVD